MNDKEMDRLLRIKTEGNRQWSNQSSHYNRYEATPYRALDELFQNYTVEKKDVFIDYGCGKGRFPIYVNNLFGVSATGIEMKSSLFQEALENQANYMKKTKMRGLVRFECCLAEDYEVEATDNRFYFFNPFSSEIFSNVVNQILRSCEANNRSVDIILYYPTSDYIAYLNFRSPFTFAKEIRVPELYDQNSNERFVIYRYES